jgi:hypothetical protein
MRVPGVGFAGFNQMTPASRVALEKSGNVGATRGTRKRRRAKAAKPRARKARRAKGGRKLKFGSPAWRKKYNKKK